MRDTMSAPTCCPNLPIGSKGTLEGVDVEVVGWAAWRTSDGYPYHEMVLRTSEAAWWTLEVDQGHMMLHRPLKEGPVDGPQGVPRGGTVRWDRLRTPFPRGRAQLVTREGEYWKDLQVGDRVDYYPFYGGPTVMGASREVGEDDEPWEWTLGVYIDPKRVGDAFGVSLPPPNLAELHPARPAPYSPVWRAAKWVFLLAAIGCIVAALALPSVGPSGPLFQKTLTLDPATSSGEQYLGVFDMDSDGTIGVRTAAQGLNNTWAFVQVVITAAPGDGASPETFEPEALVRATSEMGFYHGVEGGESWSEDDRRKSDGFRASAGSYMAFLSWELDPRQRRPISLAVSIERGYVNVLPLLIAGGVWLLIFFAIWGTSRSYWHRVLVDNDLKGDS